MMNYFNLTRIKEGANMLLLEVTKLMLILELWNSITNYTNSGISVGDKVSIAVPSLDITSTDDKRIFGKVIDVPKDDRY